MHTIKAQHVNKVVITDRVIDFDDGGVLLPGEYDVADYDPRTNEIEFWVDNEHGGKKRVRKKTINPDDYKDESQSIKFK